eukprot:763221-Hanusia_phi.AAC.3
MAGDGVPRSSSLRLKSSSSMLIKHDEQDSCSALNAERSDSTFCSARRTAGQPLASQPPLYLSAYLICPLLSPLPALPLPPHSPSSPPSSSLPPSLLVILYLPSPPPPPPPAPSPRPSLYFDGQVAGKSSPSYSTHLAFQARLRLT